MDGPTLKKMALLKKSYLDRACSIVADLAHAGGPCPCASLTMSCRQRAETLVQEMNALKHKRELVVARAKGKKKIHYGRDTGHDVVAVCNSHITPDPYMVTLDAEKVTCAKCMRTWAWKRAFDPKGEET